MKRILMVFAAAVMGIAMSIGNADAANRLGSGKNVGSQRDGVTQRQATPPAAAAAPASGMSRWLGPLAGIAAGLGLAYLFGNQAGSILLVLLLVAAAFFAYRMFARRNAPQTAGAGAGGGQINGNSQFSGLGRDRASSGTAGATALGGVGAAAATSVPAGFDTVGFASQAKQAFIQLQAANDRNDLATLKEMTTDDMFNAIRQEIEARNGAAQHVEVVTVNADVLEVVTEGTTHWASVRFSGALREEAGAVPEKFVEVWNMKKPIDGSAGWLLAGIQQS